MFSLGTLLVGEHQQTKGKIEFRFVCVYLTHLLSR